MFYKVNAYILLGCISFLIIASMLMAQERDWIFPRTFLLLIGRLIFIYGAIIFLSLPLVLFRTGIILTGGSKEKEPKRFWNQFILIVCIDVIMIVYIMVKVLILLLS